jgi:hypothetical protein
MVRAPELRINFVSKTERYSRRPKPVNDSNLLGPKLVIGRRWVTLS